MQKDLLGHFRQIQDPRVDRTKRYPFIEILFLVISAAVSGCEGWKSIQDFGLMKLDWLRRFLPYASGIPVDDTIARVMRRLDTKQFQQCFVQWMQGVAQATDGEVVAIDGKTLRRSYDKASSKSAIHMVSAWCSANGVVLGQEKTAEKSNEITAIPQLLDVLALKGCIVSIDAMGCQQEIARKIRRKQADYILALKGNQGHLHADVKRFFTDAQAHGFEGVQHDFHEEWDAGHGRIEHRQCFSIDPAQYQGCFSHLKKWPGLNRLFMVQTERQLADKTTQDTRFYITSCSSSAACLMNLVRKHWQVENALHWTLDVTFQEDASRIRAGKAPENYAILRHIALNVIKKDTSMQASVRRKRNMAALNDNFRTTLIQHAF